MSTIEKNKSYNAPDPAVTSGRNISYWLDSTEHISFVPLANDITTDVVIVGGGIAGLSIAYSLIQSGKKVVVIDDGNIGSGETGRTTAHLVTALDDRYYNLESLFGEKQTRLIAESQKSAIDFIERTVKNHAIDCDFERVDGYLFLHPTDKRESLRDELKAVHKAGIEAVELPYAPGLSEPYDPSRFKLFSAGDVFFTELVGGTISYLKNKPGDVASIELANIPTDEGKIFELEGKKVGAYRDKNNALHVVSAECTHLKCIVKWNNSEKIWDCPCHGSRFTYDGKVVNGPANSDLPYYTEKDGQAENTKK